MDHTQRTDDKRFRTIATWVDTYAEHVLRYAFLYTNSMEQAERLTVRSFAQTYRRMDISHVYLTDKNAVFGGVVTACRSDEFQITQNKPAPGASNDDAEVRADTSAVPSQELKAGTCSGDALHIADRIRRLPADLRIPLLLATVAGLDLADITRILLLPRRVVQSRLRSAVVEIDPAMAEQAPKQVQLSDLMSVYDRLSECTADLRVSEALYSRIRKIVAATIQEMKAERRHRGPRWLTYAAVLTGLASLLAVDVGVRGILPPRTAAPTAASVSGTLTGLPSALAGLPVSTDAQFKLTSLPEASSLDHVVLTGSGMYLPKLEESVDAWPSIQVRYLTYADKGQDFTTVTKAPVAAIDMVPPIVRSTGKGTGASADWKVVGWRFDVTGHWAVASVNWMSDQSRATVGQLYLLYLPTGQSNLVKTFGSSTATGSAQIFVSAVGDGRVIIQRAVTNSLTQPPGESTVHSGTSAKSGTGNRNGTGGRSNGGTSSSLSSGQSVVGLPVEVYQLSGTEPLHALGTPTQVPAPFGLMQDPSVFSSGIMFMGIAGQPSDANAPNTTWYLMSWNGDLTRFVGPPVDGQAHYALAGNTADFWWAETTPNQGVGTTVYTKWQVLMSPLTGDTAAQSPALNLAQPVAWFGGYGNHVAWIQDTQKQLQLVVASVK
ncbi:RNA polymerase sigma factor [Alicyclobacillus ferrooxydans]|uniref:Uncharacterized protein n=1 Tax=Alicyclobacillus ferrooxydans TaxID=471514 RepID=A0A0P9CKY3_9BACL|nr:hypothetical protein [Alicyclobacillus ferrooxydans]KPV43666.1 hypothetical protein AN477_10830 [Alicyclobacillus ferrooxydans]